MFVWLCIVVFVADITLATADQCISNQCEHGGICEASFKCLCPRGWGGERCDAYEGVIHDFEQEFKFTNVNNNLETIRGGANSIPSGGYRGTWHYGKVSSGSSFTLSTDRIGIEEIKYCMKLAYSLQGQSSKLSIEQESSNGVKNILWQKESESVFGTFGEWEPLEFSFFGKPQSKLLIEGEASPEGFVAIDEIEVYPGSC